MDYYAEVKKILSQVTPSTVPAFSRLKTNQERVQFCLQLDYINDAFQIEANFVGKSAPEATNLRDKGNKSYQSMLYPEALELYSKSVLVAPYPQLNPSHSHPEDLDKPKVEAKVKGDKYKGHELTLALANRSAALFQLQNFKLVISDIKLALEYGYPKELHYKLYDRMAKSFMELEIYSDAVSSFEKAKESLKLSTLEAMKQEQWFKDIEKLREFCELSLETNKSGQLQINSMENVIVPKLSADCNKRFPGASSSMDIKFSGASGRYTFAQSPVNIGEVLLVEKPYVSIMSPEYSNTHCHHCLNETLAPIACHQCSSLRYCSEECRDLSWSAYHRLECKLLKVVEEAGVGKMALLAWRVINVTGRQSLINLTDRLNKITPAENKHATKKLPILLDKDGMYMANFESLYTLLAHTPSRPPNELLQYTMLSVFLLKVLDKSGYFKEPLQKIEGKGADDSEEAYVGGILLRFLQIICCNANEIMQTNMGATVQNAYQTTLGLALYPTASLANHSCNPNMEMIYYGNTCVLRAIRNVQNGEELTIDFGYVYYLTSKPQRQMSLRSQYYFDCHCEACTLNWQIKSKLPSGSTIVKCQNCGGPLNWETGSEESSSPMAVKCGMCADIQNPFEMMEILTKDEIILAKTLFQVNVGEMQKVVSALERHLTLMETYMRLPVKEYVTYLFTLKQCYRLQGNSASKN